MVDNKKIASTLETVHGLTAIHQLDVVFHPIELAHNPSTMIKRLHKLEETVQELNAIG